MALDFEKITVVEVTEVIAGPSVGQILSDLGASVIKIENPHGGDPSRRQGDPKLFESGSLYHMMNRGKRSVALDLKDPVERDALRSFVESKADVFIQNLRPGTIERHGLGAEEMLQRAPRLVYCSVSGFPHGTQSYPRPGYDLILQAFSGILQTTGEPDRAPVRLGISTVDQTAGLWAAIAIMQALVKRELTGRGGVIHTSLLEAATYLMSAQIGQYQFTGQIPQRWGTGLKEFVPLRVYRTSDGEVALAAASDKLFRAFAAALDRHQLAEDPRFVTTRDRERHRGELNAIIEAALATGSTRFWSERLARFGIPVSPVNSVKELIESDALTESGQLGEIEQMEGLKVVQAPFRHDGRRPPVRRRSERLGESTQWFLAQLKKNDTE